MAFVRQVFPNTTTKKVVVVVVVVVVRLTRKRTTTKQYVIKGLGFAKYYCHVKIKKFEMDCTRSTCGETKNVYKISVTKAECVTPLKNPGVDVSILHKYCVCVCVCVCVWMRSAFIWLSTA
jgi:hypothetical protein